MRFGRIFRHRYCVNLFQISAFPLVTEKAARLPEYNPGVGINAVNWDWAEGLELYQARYYLS